MCPLLSTVKSKTTPTAAPTAAPSAAPSVAPSADPSAVPSDAASAVPSDAASAAPSADVSAQPSADVSAEPSKEPSKVTEIKILSKEALVSKDRKTAFIYYDVLDQYNESMRTSVNINWTSSTGNVTDNRSTGQLQVIRTDDLEFTYASPLYIVGVDVTNGISVSEQVPIGLERAVNTISFEGFAAKSDKSKKLNDLPANFSKEEYVLLYKTMDQDGAEIEASTSNVTDQNLTFISNNPLLVSSEIKDAGQIYTIDGVDYNAVTIEPGTYVDKGGEFTITAISNKTGAKAEKVYALGSTGLLKSLKLSAPTKTVADYDENVKIPYTAVDTDGNAVTRYETIVRSTNNLVLKASDGKLKIKEENDGTAGIYWSDSTVLNWDNYDKDGSGSFYTASKAWDNQARIISLTTVVVGGDSNNMNLNVSDIRRPNAIKSITFSPDKADTFAVGTTATTKTGNDDNYAIKYLDQYGEELSGAAAISFFKETKTSGSTFNGYFYGIKVDMPDSNNTLTTTDEIVENAGDVSFIATGSDVNENAVKFSIARIKDTSTATTGTRTSTTWAADKADAAKWDDASKIVTNTYTTVPVAKLTDFAIGSIGTLKVNSDYKNKANAEGATGGALATSDGTVNVLGGSSDFKVTGTYKKTSVTVPNAYYDLTDYDYTVAGGKVATIKNVTLADLYDFNTAKNTRKIGSKKIAVDVYPDTTGQVKYTAYETIKAQVKVVTGCSLNAASASDIKTKLDTALGGTGVIPGVTYTVNGTDLEMNLTNQAFDNGVSIEWGSADTGWVVVLKYGDDKLALQLFGGDKPTDGLVTKSAQNRLASPTQTIKFSDGPSVAQAVYFVAGNYGGKTSSWTSTPTDTKYTAAAVGCGEWSGSFGVYVVDQYGDAMDGSTVSINVSNINEKDDAETHLKDSFVVNKNNSSEAAIEGAEIGDSYTLTATEENTGLTATCTVTVGADTLSYITSSEDDSPDETFRKGTLKFAY